MILEFSKNFYSPKAVRAAMKAYKDLADFELKKDKSTLRVFLRNIDKAFADSIKDEFANYVLFLSLKLNKA